MLAEETLASAMPLIAPKDVKLKTKIGAGAFASIYKGTWRGLSVAAKVATKHDEGVLAGRHTDADIADIFFREVKILRFAATNAPKMLAKIYSFFFFFAARCVTRILLW